MWIAANCAPPKIFKRTYSTPHSSGAALGGEREEPLSLVAADRGGVACSECAPTPRPKQVPIFAILNPSTLGATHGRRVCLKPTVCHVSGKTSLRRTYIDIARFLRLCPQQPSAAAGLWAPIHVHPPNLAHPLMSPPLLTRHVQAPQGGQPVPQPPTGSFGGPWPPPQRDGRAPLLDPNGRQLPVFHGRSTVVFSRPLLLCLPSEEIQCASGVGIARNGCTPRWQAGSTRRWQLRRQLRGIQTR